MPRSTPSAARWLLPVIHLAVWLPAANLAWIFSTKGWPFNPIQDLTFATGLPALTLLLLSLAVTPLITLTGWGWLAPARRWLGLYAGAYALVHVFIFAVLDYGLDLGQILDIIAQKRYILAGLGALLLMLPLALTSTAGWQKRLGRNWKRLHWGAYLAGGLAVAHFVWLVKADWTLPLAYSAVLALLLFLRVPAVRARLAGWRRSFTGSVKRAGQADSGIELRE